MGKALEPANKKPETIYRDKFGRKITREKFVSQYDKNKVTGRIAPKKQVKAKATVQTDLDMEWATGVRQDEMEAAIQAEHSSMALEPMTRYADNAKLNEEMKQVLRWDDPLFRKKARESLNASEKPKCPFDTPANRYNIPAGYRWDGVVRGNGFEAKRFHALNEKKFKEEEKFMYGQAFNL